MNFYNSTKLFYFNQSNHFNETNSQSGSSGVTCPGWGLMAHFPWWRPRSKHCCIYRTFLLTRENTCMFFVWVHITFFPCGSSARQGCCLGCMEFSKEKCMTSDHTLASGWGFGWLCFGILTLATNKDLVLSDYISQLWEPPGRVDFFVVPSMSVKHWECRQQRCTL